MNFTLKNEYQKIQKLKNALFIQNEFNNEFREWKSLETNFQKSHHSIEKSEQSATRVVAANRCRSRFNRRSNHSVEFGVWNDGNVY